MKIVSVRENRNCMYCHTVITKGTKCITKSQFIKRDFVGRRWICFECLHKMCRYWDTISEERLLPEGDLEAKAKHELKVFECKDELKAIGYFE